MNMMVVGCGPTGCSLISRLQAEGHEVSALAETAADLELLRTTLGADMPGLSRVGRAIDVDVLRAAGIESMNAVAAATENDNVNVMVCEIARKVFGVDRSVAVLHDPVRRDVLQKHLGLRAVCSTSLAADALAVALEGNLSPRQLTLGSTTVSFVPVKVTRKLAGKPLAEFDKPKGHVVFGVQRAVGDFIAASDFCTLLSEDDLIILWRVAD